MELTFNKNGANQVSVSDESGETFTLLLNPLDKVWTVKQGTKVKAKGIKGLAAAQKSAQAIEDSLCDDDDDDNRAEQFDQQEPDPIRRVSKSAAVKPAVKVTTKAVPAAKVPVATPAKAVPAKKVKPFPDFDVWANDNVELLPVPKSGAKKAGIELQNTNTLKGAKLKHGRERAAYNRNNGIAPATPAKATPATKTARVPKTKVERVKLTSGERFGAAFGGEAFHDFGPSPTPFEYALAQLSNSTCSKVYNVVHSRLHPYSLAAQGSYQKAVERQYVNEMRLWEIMQELDADGESYKLPKGFQFDYYNSNGVPTELVGEAEEGYSALEGYVFTGFGKLETGKGVTLPVELRAPVKRAARK